MGADGRPRTTATGRVPKVVILNAAGGSLEPSTQPSDLVKMGLSGEALRTCRGPRHVRREEGDRSRGRIGDQRCDMTDRRFEELHDPVLAQEIELLGEVMEAVSTADRPLAGGELDEALGLQSWDGARQTASHSQDPSTQSTRAGHNPAQLRTTAPPSQHSGTAPQPALDEPATCWSTWAAPGPPETARSARDRETS